MELKEFALKLRKNLTEEESILWYHLRKKQLAGFHFRKQAVIAPYIVDFICYKAKLIIEIDGEQHFLPSALVYDEKRTFYLKSKGFRVIRFTNYEIKRELDSVLDKIWYELTGEF
ncbi:endonuclease domain-containing protein [Basfia succiniciproducens]|uniref:endonuclease domain-containing protein n=1 Tax=Basfia succiniciproducens TaxID=653940 RepID=UPI0008D7E112|nr:endonuclease domain-containing protein [Basfia succiniciproducens]SEQ31552.1 Very-short-patch-repair endonuclease [Basfia succiniciproducens]